MEVNPLEGETVLSSVTSFHADPILLSWSTRPIKVGRVLASGYPWRVLEGSVQWDVGEGLALLFIATPRPEPRLLSSHGLYSMCHLEINHMTPRGISSFVLFNSLSHRHAGRMVLPCIITWFPIFLQYCTPGPSTVPDMCGSGMNEPES